YGDQADVGQYMRQMADQVDRFAGYLESRDVGEVMDQVEDFARRQPAAFIGGAFTLGLIGARFLKSSRERLDDDNRRWDNRYLPESSSDFDQEVRTRETSRRPMDTA